MYSKIGNPFVLVMSVKFEAGLLEGFLIQKYLLFLLDLARKSI